MKRRMFFRMGMVLFLSLNLALPAGLMAQGAKEEGPGFRPEEIDQMVAPIALYPDALLAQILTASTYPLEIVQAGQFVQKNKDLKGEKLLQAAKDKEWEPSVKAMLSFPDVLLMMSEKLEWTEKVGNAFLGQQKDVMDSVQRLRKKAQESGNLKTTKEQKVVVEKEAQVIVIESASPEVVYVPTYNPTVVYGAWPYPAYPPAPVYPPGYVATAAFSFAAGVAVGAAVSGYGGWGCGWGNNEININASTTNNFTKNNYNNPQKYQVNASNKNQSWQHNPEHRGNAQYKDQKTAQKYGQQRSSSGSSARPASSESRGYGGAGDKGGGKPQASDSSRGGGKESALSGSGNGGSERASSNRGQESRSSASRSSSGGSGSSSGSGSRGGGGRGGGGGGRGGR
jgi:hypothetical protein